MQIFKTNNFLLKLSEYIAKMELTKNQWRKLVGRNYCWIEEVVQYQKQKKEK